MDFCGAQIVTWGGGFFPRPFIPLSYFRWFRGAKEPHQKIMTQDTIKATRRIGSNRGNRRIWLEGTGALKALDSLGWIKGTTYKRETMPDGFTLTKSAEGRLRVAGSQGRPVFDLCGAYVTKAMTGADQVSVTVTPQKITIKKI